MSQTHTMLERFYYRNFSAGETVELDGPEAHHALHVLRMKPGQKLELFDGLGQVGTAEIATVSRRSLELRVTDARIEASPAGADLILGVAVPKGDRFRWLVEKATELGVARLVPLELERSVVEPGATKLDKLRQTVIAACKQSRRGRLMEIDEPTPWRHFVETVAQDRQLVVAHPGGETLRDVVRSSSEQMRWAAAIGPEGGFTDAEIEFARSHDARIRSMGATILRIETAAVAIAAIMTTTAFLPSPEGERGRG